MSRNRKFQPETKQLICDLSFSMWHIWSSGPTASINNEGALKTNYRARDVLSVRIYP